MPSGLYRRARDDGTEQFRCAPGPMGWRYFSTVQDERGTTNVDLSVDASWRPVRVRIQTPEHHLLVTSRGGMLTGMLDEEPLDIPFDPSRTAVEYPSPCFHLVTARWLNATAEVDALAFDADSLLAQPEH